MPRRFAITPERRDKLLNALRAGALYRDAAGAAGIPWSTWTDWCREVKAERCNDPDVVALVEAAREAWPSLKSHSLGALAETFGLDLVHHDAHSDAVACALVYLAARHVKTLRAKGDSAIRVALVFAAGTRAVRAS